MHHPTCARHDISRLSSFLTNRPSALDNAKTVHGVVVRGVMAVIVVAHTGVTHSMREKMFFQTMLRKFYSSRGTSAQASFLDNDHHRRGSARDIKQATKLRGHTQTQTRTDTDRH